MIIKMSLKETLWVLLTMGLLLLVIILSMMCGTSFITLSEIIAYFMHPSESVNQFTLEVLRLPRITLALLTGMAFGISGLLLQNVLKNPIASPDIIGVTGGASLCAVSVITLFNSISIHMLPLFAILGGTLAMMCLLLFQFRTPIRPSTLIIIGIALQTLFIALTHGLMVTSKEFAASKAYTWLVGSLYGSAFEDTFAVLITIIAIIPILILLIPRMKVAALDDDIGRALGLHLKQTKLLQLIVATILVSVSVSYVGNIGFVGLIAPHIAKTLIKQSTLKQVMMSACIGALSILLADLVGRTLFLPKEIPAGVFIAAFGAPFFIYLLLTVKKM
ncbi:iron ABC transporter permease [Staphylococcus hyicus]|uniref:FecCD family ABC transporter permease n=1 Tax=Staphylococcus hyicus TaxID=1284 RepID=UPI00208E78FA|nr:iron ABC transporter permease [Staphylococcus hyicus]MCO4329730.1 iron ABC transporter permease [Staphylococcus hyicus]MCO4337279.1 iron ABC transporter permease [Staphylococcus hyicus]